MELLDRSGHSYKIRWAKSDDAPLIRAIVNQAYRELADLGLNYTATYQDEAETLRRMANSRVLVIEDEGRAIGTILMREENKIDQRRAAYLGQFGFLPEYKGRGLGRQVMDFMEQLALREGYECVQLDTAKPAAHLVSMYLRRGYRIVGETHFEGKTYHSYIFEKNL